MIEDRPEAACWAVHSESITGGHLLRPGDIRFSGGMLPAPLYLSAGPGQFALNVYRARRSLSDARPVTAYGENRGVTGFAVGRNGELVVAVQNQGVEHILVHPGRASKPPPPATLRPSLPTAGSPMPPRSTVAMTATSR
jgi:hypothetical protein